MKRLGYFYITVVLFIWAIDPILFKFWSSYASSSVQNFFRCIIATVIFTLLMFFSKDTMVKNEAFRIDIKKYIVPVILDYIMIQAYVTGIGLTKANLASFIMFSLCVSMLVPILAIFIPEERKQAKNIFAGLAIILGIIGSALVLLDFNSLTTLVINKGVILLLIGNLAFCLSTVYYRKYFIDYSPVIYSRNVVLLNCILFTVTIIVNKEVFTLNQLEIGFIGGITITALLIDVVCGIALLKAYQLISAVRANVITIFAPILTLVISGLLLKEGLTFVQVVGCTLVFLSSILIALSEIINGLVEKQTSLEKDFVYEERHPWTKRGRC